MSAGEIVIVLVAVVLCVAGVWGTRLWLPARQQAREVERRRQESIRAEQERQRELERIQLCSEAEAAWSILERAMTSLQSTEYLATSDVNRWKVNHQDALTVARRTRLADYLPPDQSGIYRTWCRELQALPQTIQQRNEQFIARRMSEDKDAFDRVERYPLTSNQRRAIITNEDTTLVIAGAGTGKTSTIIGKVDYLVRHGMALPEDILVLAFNRSASDELKMRLSRFRHLDRVRISTFHAFGLRVIGQAEGVRPALSPMAEDSRELKMFIRERLREMLTSRPSQRLLISLLAHHLDETRPNDSAKTGDALIREQQARGLRALNGRMLKSREEVQIANWLTLNGIRWEYERPYPFHAGDQRHRRYQPDFYLPEFDLYIEHFGINERGQTAPHIDTETYRRSMEWKRALHREHGTRLIETFSSFRSQGGLVEHLETLLSAQGVVGNPLTQADIDQVTADTNRPFADFVDLIAQFLTLHQSNGGDRDAADARASSTRDRVFLQVFWPLFDAYRAEMASHGQIDFNDMINQARACIRAGRLRERFTYIIVDEFQDISENRLGLLQDLRARVTHGRLFGVGDDWQSIFRFGGSDVSIITSLADRVGPTQRVDLDVAFRYSQELLDATTRFIQQNPLQLRKYLRAQQGRAGEIPIFVLLAPGEQHSTTSTQAFDTVLADIVQHASGEPATVFVLGRYHFSGPASLDRIAKDSASKGLVIEFSTAHSAKGKEADYVIVVGLEAGEFGFPANIADDPVMKMMLSAEDSFPYAEERRLFYVALTRARRRVYLIAPQDNASPFVAEDILSEPYRPYVEIIGEASARHRCPNCQGNTIRRTIGQHGVFWACSHYPLCNGKLETCPNCSTGGLTVHSNTGGANTYRCTDCGRDPATCPQCGHGYLRQKSGAFGPFLGCSQWRRDGTGCAYTRNID